tara:strand:+ start:30196 stop:30843 length:648 start_codon:yes stop_codon:yes gene_type:complete
MTSLITITCTNFSLIRVRQLIVLLMLIPTLAHAEQWDIKQLMHDLAQVRSSHAFFVEKKSIAMLTAPIESSGELIYTAPNHLEKRTIKPKQESMILDNDTLIIELSTRQHSPIGHQNSNQKYQLQLQNYPEIAVFIDSIRGTLAGDITALQQNYQLSLVGNADNWTLSLSPTNEKMQALVQCIDISGSHDEIQRIKISQTDGDSSLMLIDQQTTP